MEKRTLREHKLAHKMLVGTPDFRNIKRKKLPRPFQQIGGDRIHGTPLLEVSDDYVLFFYYRDGETLQDRSFYGYLLHKVAKGLYPILEFHWHPSHKGFHCKVPCDTLNDYTNRVLPGAPELRMRTDARLDPREPNDRLKLIHVVCNACGVTLSGNASPDQAPLWEQH